MNLRDQQSRQAFRFGRTSGLRSASDAFDQTLVQLHAERAAVARLTREVSALKRDVAQLRLVKLLAMVPSPSGSVH